MKKSTNIKADDRATVKVIVLALASIGLASLPMTAVLANPQGGQVIAGSAAIRQETPNKVGITQSTDKAIIDWRSFSIDANQHTQFYQPSASAVTLNRVVGADPSQILGRLTANGQVFLVNPNGIYFGKNAQIDVAGLVASTHNIRNEDFLAGKYNFNLPGKPGAAVINEGTIRIADTGIAAFVAPSVANRGVIVAKLGKVALAAANGFTLDFTGDQLLTFLVSDEVAKTAFDLEGKQLTSFVENAGRIEAHGGYVLLTAKAAENAIHSVINQSGVIEATTVGTHNGEIILNAGKGSLSVSGTLDASAPGGGDGGFIETSGGHVAIDPSTKITTAAPFGKTGRWLIDPTDYTIAASGGDITGAALATYLGASNVEIQTLPIGSGNGDIFVNDGVHWKTINKLTLTAHRNIYVNEAINGTGGGSVKLRADAEGTSVGTVVFAGNGRVIVNGQAEVTIYYNPTSYTDDLTRSWGMGDPYSDNGKVVLNGSSTLTSYMLVNDVTQLQAMNTNDSGNYALGKNIDASATAGWNEGAGFAPVKLGGMFDGLDHTISNLTINRPITDVVGLFGLSTWAGSVIKNVGMVGGSVIGRGSVGGLVGFNNGTVSSSYATGPVTGSASSYGGIGGLVGKNSGTVSNSYATGAVMGSGIIGSGIGGLVGFGNFGTVINSYATGSITGSGNGSNVGGLIGLDQNGTINNSYATGAVTNNGDHSVWIGGLVGGSVSSTVSNSYATGSVINVGQGNQVGGLVGQNYSGTVNNSYATGLVTSTGFNTQVGGLVGFNAGTVTNSYWDTQTSGQAMSAGGTGLTTAQMQQQANFIGWDFINTWEILPGATRPTLKVFNVQTVTPVPPIVTPPSNLTPAQTLLVQQHQNDNPSMLLIAIGNGLFANSTLDPVWVGMYKDGKATQAQVTANSLWPKYDKYKSATTSKVLEGLANGDIVYGGTIWTALGSANQKNRNDAYYSYTHPTLPSTLTVAQQQLVNAHKNDTVTQLLLAIADGLFTNSSQDPVWVGLYQSGAATDVQKETNRLRNIYDAYTSADIFSLIRTGQLKNDSTDTSWHAIYRNGHASAAQIAANGFANTYDKYKGTSANTLFNGIVAGDISPNPAATNAVVWQALVKQNLSGTNKAAQMADIYDTYKNADTQTLVNGLIDKSSGLIAGDNAVWNALKTNPHRDEALSRYTQATSSYEKQEALYTTYKNATVEQILDALLNKWLVVDRDQVAWMLLGQNPNSDIAYKRFRAIKTDPCQASQQACKPDDKKPDPQSDNNNSGSEHGNSLPPLDPEFRELFGKGFVDNPEDKATRNIIGILPLADQAYYWRMTNNITNGIPVTKEEFQKLRNLSTQIQQHLNRIKGMYGPNPPTTVLELLEKWEAQDTLLKSDAWEAGGDLNKSELKKLAMKSALAGGVDLLGKSLSALETMGYAMDVYQKFAKGENVYASIQDLAVNASGYNPLLGPVLASLQTMDMIAGWSGNGVQDTLKTLSSIVTNQNTMFASQVDSITTLLAQNKISLQNAMLQLSQSQALAVSSMNDAMQILASTGFRLWQTVTSNFGAGKEISDSIRSNQDRISQIKIDDLQPMVGDKMRLGVH